MYSICLPRHRDVCDARAYAHLDSFAVQRPREKTSHYITSSLRVRGTCRFLTPSLVRFPLNSFDSSCLLRFSRHSLRASTSFTTSSRCCISLSFLSGFCLQQLSPRLLSHFPHVRFCATLKSLPKHIRRPLSHDAHTFLPSTPPPSSPTSLPHLASLLFCHPAKQFRTRYNKVKCSLTHSASVPFPIVGYAYFGSVFFRNCTQVVSASM